jgi:hypothetical protein
MFKVKEITLEELFEAYCSGSLLNDVEFYYGNHTYYIPISLRQELLDHIYKKMSFDEIKGNPSIYSDAVILKYYPDVKPINDYKKFSHRHHQEILLPYEDVILKHFPELLKEEHEIWLGEGKDNSESRFLFKRLTYFIDLSEPIYEEPDTPCELYLPLRDNIGVNVFFANVCNPLYAYASDVSSFGGGDFLQMKMKHIEEFFVKIKEFPHWKKAFRSTDGLDELLKSGVIDKKFYEDVISEQKTTTGLK